jgi:hypothetical protein
MKPKLRVYGLNLWIPDGPEEPNGNRQRRAIVAARNQKEAATALSVSPSYLRTYGGETGNAREIELATANPGQAFWEYRGSPSWSRDLASAPFGGWLLGWLRAEGAEFWSPVFRRPQGWRWSRDIEPLPKGVTLLAWAEGPGGDSGALVCCWQPPALDPPARSVPCAPVPCAPVDILGGPAGRGIGSSQCESLKRPIGDTSVLLGESWPLGWGSCS